MSIFYDDGVVKKLHIELTNACNSKCPLCPRTGTPIVGNSGIKNLTLEDIKKINFQNLEVISFCGNFVIIAPALGSCIIGKEDLSEHFKK